MPRLRATRRGLIGAFSVRPGANLTLWRSPELQKKGQSDRYTRYQSRARVPVCGLIQGIHEIPVRPETIPGRDWNRDRGRAQPKTSSDGARDVKPKLKCSSHALDSRMEIVGFPPGSTTVDSGTPSSFAIARQLCPSCRSPRDFIAAETRTAADRAPSRWPWQPAPPTTFARG
jgi:hypothetical protein